MLVKIFHVQLGKKFITVDIFYKHISWLKNLRVANRKDIL